MDLEKVNRLPSPTWRYLKTNDSALPFQNAERPAKAVWSDTTYMTEGAVLPARFEGASAAWKEAAASGECRTVRIPAGTRAVLRAEIAMDEAAPDFAGTYVFHVEKGAELRLVWQWKGGGEDGVCAVAAAYELEDGRCSMSPSPRRVSRASCSACSGLLRPARARRRNLFPPISAAVR